MSAHTYKQDRGKQEKSLLQSVKSDVPAAGCASSRPKQRLGTHILLTPDLMQLLMGTSINCIFEPANKSTLLVCMEYVGWQTCRAKFKSLWVMLSARACLSRRLTKLDGRHCSEPSQSIGGWSSCQQDGLHTTRISSVFVVSINLPRSVTAGKAGSTLTSH